MDQEKINKVKNDLIDQYNHAETEELVKIPRDLLQRLINIADDMLLDH